MGNLLLFCFVVFGVQAQQQHPVNKKAWGLFQQARESFREGDKEKALGLLLKAETFDQGFSPLYLLKADIYNKKGDKIQEIRAIETALALDSLKSHPYYYFILAEYYFDEADYGKALAHYGRYLSWDKRLQVKAVAELMPYSGGLKRNIVQCLDDYDIPLKLSHTVVDIKGKERLEGITLAQVDSHGKPIPGTEEIIPCDTVLLSIGLIPENELSKKAGIELNPVTNGPKVDNALETSVKGIFACGNVLHVHDLVDQVTKEAEDAGTYAAEYAAECAAAQQADAAVSTDAETAAEACGTSNAETEIAVIPEGMVRYTVPTRICANRTPVTKIKFRVGRPVETAKIRITSGDKVIFESKKAKKFVPSIMENVNLTAAQIADVQDEIKVTLV